MALSKNLKDRLEIALTDAAARKEIEKLLNSAANPQGAAVANLAASTDLPAAAAIAPSYADLAAARTSVNALRSDVEAISSGAETRLDAIEAKVNALLVSLRNAGIIAS
jgi:hypothetical protein